MAIEMYRSTRTPGHNRYFLFDLFPEVCWLVSGTFRYPWLVSESFAGILLRTGGADFTAPGADSRLKNKALPTLPTELTSSTDTADICYLWHCDVHRKAKHREVKSRMRTIRSRSEGESTAFAQVVRMLKTHIV